MGQPEYFGRVGWVECDWIDDPKFRVWAFVRPGQHRIAVVALHIEPKDPADEIASTVFRSIQIPMIEKMVNTTGRRTLLAAEFMQQDPAWADVRVSAFRHSPPTAPGVLKVPARGAKYPDSFFEDVAAAYRSAIANGDRPGPTLAAMNNVPVSSVHGWIKQARQRGFLPPGRHGKLG